MIQIPSDLRINSFPYLQVSEIREISKHKRQVSSVWEEALKKRKISDDWLGGILKKDVWKLRIGFQKGLALKMTSDYQFAHILLNKITDFKFYGDDDIPFRKKLAFKIAQAGAKDPAYCCMCLASLAEKIHEFKIQGPEHEDDRLNIAKQFFKHPEGAYVLLINIKKLEFNPKSERELFLAALRSGIAVNWHWACRKLKSLELNESQTKYIQKQHDFLNSLRRKKALKAVLLDPFCDSETGLYVDAKPLIDCMESHLIKLPKESKERLVTLLKEMKTSLSSTYDRDTDRKVSLHSCYKAFFNELKLIPRSYTERRVLLRIVHQLDFCIREVSSTMAAVDQVAAFKDPDLKERVAKWVYFFVLNLLFIPSRSKSIKIFNSNFLDVMVNLHDQELKYVYSRVLFSLASHLSDREFSETLDRINSPKKALPVQLALETLKQRGVSVDAGFELISRKAFLQDGVKLVLLLECLDKMMTSSRISKDAIEKLFSYMKELDDVELKGELISLKALFALQKEVRFDSGSERISSLLMNEFKALMPNRAGMNEIELSRFREVFFCERNPSALPAYACGLCELPSFQRQVVFENLHRFIQDVVSEKFPLSRYQDSPHLDLIDPVLLKKWMAGYSEPLAAAMKGILWLYKNNPSRVQKDIPNIHDYTLEDTDDPMDLFLCGTEVDGSCQSVSSQALENQALLGYVMNGANRILIIRDSTGKMVARAILRLLWDKGHRKPVLFLEKVYQKGYKTVFEVALKNFAIRRAEALGLDLLTKEWSKDRCPSAVAMTALKTPYEYCDANRCNHEEPFEITECYFLKST